MEGRQVLFILCLLYSVDASSDQQECEYLKGKIDAYMSIINDKVKDIETGFGLYKFANSTNEQIDVLALMTSYIPMFVNYLPLINLYYQACEPVPSIDKTILAFSVIGGIALVIMCVFLFIMFRKINYLKERTGGNLIPTFSAEQS
jgi:hypothetical protein